MKRLEEYIKIPTKEEYINNNEISDEITEEYIKLQSYYRFFASAFLEEKLGLSRLDKRLEEEGFAKVRDEDKNFQQKYENSGMKYIYLRSKVHIERLNQKEFKILQELNGAYKEDEIRRVAELVEETWKKVLQLCPERPACLVEEYASIDGSGNFTGDTILLGISSSFKYSETGSIVDIEKEDRRIKIMLSVGKQLEKIATLMLQNPIKVVVEV